MEMLFPANLLASIEKIKIRKAEELTTEICNKPGLTENTNNHALKHKLLQQKINYNN